MTKRKPHGKMCIVTINLPEKYLLFIEKLTKWGITPSRSEYIRSMSKEIIKKDLDFIERLDNLIGNGTVIEEGKDTDNHTIRIPGYNGDKPVQIIKRLEY